ncbi:MAG: hypothetical protein JWM18_3442 [Chloroflexi bacterium]|nr:hypothetical protein [Chloroflexota bacterium]
MAESNTYPRCWKGHPAGERCRHATSALDAHRPSPSQLQHVADAAESLALIRFHLSRSR